MTAPRSTCERLIAGQEVRLDELDAEIVAGPSHRVAAELDAGGEVELLGVAEQVAVVPADGGVDAEIGRVGRADIDRVQRPLRDVDQDRDGAVGIDVFAGLDADHREDADAGQVLARRLELRRAVALAGTQQQAAADIVLVHRLAGR